MKSKAATAKALVPILAISLMALALTGFRKPAQNPDAEPVFSGLSQCLDESYRNGQNYLEYQLLVTLKTFVPPLSEESGDTQVYQNGMLINEDSDGEKRSSLFDALVPGRHFVYVPSSSRIALETDSQGKISWGFPDGSTLIHEIHVDVSGNSGSGHWENTQLLEVRKAQRIGGSWHYGVYDPVPVTPVQSCAGGFRLRTTSPVEVREISLPQTRYGNVLIKYRPLATSACMHCHSMGEDDAPGTSSAIGAEPCAFRDPSQNRNYTVSANTPDWITAYTRRFGHSPVEKPTPN